MEIVLNFLIILISLFSILITDYTLDSIPNLVYSKKYTKPSNDFDSKPNKYHLYKDFSKNDILKPDLSNIQSNQKNSRHSSKTFHQTLLKHSKFNNSASVKL